MNSEEATVKGKQGRIKNLAEYNMLINYVKFLLATRKIGVLSSFSYKKKVKKHELKNRGFIGLFIFTFLLSVCKLSG